MALKNLFGKKSEYFLELEEAKGTGSATAAPKAEPAAPVAAAAAETAAPKVESKKTEKAPAPKAPAPKAKKSEPAPAPAAAPAKPAPAPAKAAEPVGGFATQYLMPSTGPRRRPGPNMKTFLDMASQMRNK
jgi:hypothetical protein